MAPQFTEINRLGGSRSNRWGSRITNFLLHTQEGNGTAEGLASYLNNSANGVSYHYTLRDGVLVAVVDTDYASWSVLDANSYTINLCFAGSRASFSREQWLQRDQDLRIAAYVAVQDAHKYGFATDVIVPDYYRGEGISDHKYVTQCLGIGDHTDVGWNFPWDVFAGYVHEYATGAPAAPVVNMIDQEAERATWLGARLHEGEIPTPDGEGRRAEFEHGQIYWHPRTGAHAIPSNVFEAYAERGWEAGPLGYPIGDHTVLAGPDGKPVGDVQGFENGAIYRRYNEPGHWVHGEIRNRWNRSGYENGAYGWPTSNEIEFDTGTYQTFDNGVIYFTPKSTLGFLSTDGADTPVPDAQG
jgi:hypothetical protein